MGSSNLGTRWRVALAAAAPVLAGLALAGWGVLVRRRWFERHIFQFYFAADPSDAAREARIRVAAIVLGGCCAALGVAAARSVARGTGREFAAGAARYGVAALLALGVSELAIRHIGFVCRDDPREVREAPMEVRIGRLDFRYGWVYLPSRTTEVEVAKRSIPYSIDALGDRARTADSIPDLNAPTVIFAGESIAVGHGLTYDETYAALVGVALGEQSVNLATHGYGSDQAYLRLVDTLPKFEHPTAVITTFLPAQLERDVLTYRTHFLLGADRALTLEPPLPQPAPSRVCLIRLACSLVPYHDDRAIPLTAAILRATSDAARARGATPLFVVPSFGPERTVDEHPEGWLVHAMFDEGALPYLIVDLDDTWHLDGDWHPNARAARKIADAIVSRLALPSR